MNTRIQVEHPITEEIFGIDLIKEQIQIASNNILSIKQKDLNIKGHAMSVELMQKKFQNSQPLQVKSL